jgi:ubiquinone/menaquinone biosynthesis C-methylase UbiE
MQWDHRAFSAPNLFGVAPRRQLCAARAAGDAQVMMRIEHFLCALRRAGRRSVFIVDNKCGDGRLLIRAAKRARALGFVAIEAKGFDHSPGRIATARALALGARDPAIGFSFLVREDGAPLPVEDDEADLMLAARGEDEAAEVARVAHPDGTIVSHWLSS